MSFWQIRFQSLSDFGIVDFSPLHIYLVLYFVVIHTAYLPRDSRYLLLSLADYCFEHFNNCFYTRVCIYLRGDKSEIVCMCPYGCTYVCMCVCVCEHVRN